LAGELADIESTDELLLLPELAPKRKMDNRFPPPQVSLEFPCELGQSPCFNQLKLKLFQKVKQLTLQAVLHVVGSAAKAPPFLT